MSSAKKKVFISFWLSINLCQKESKHTSYNSCTVFLFLTFMRWYLTQILVPAQYESQPPLYDHNSQSSVETNADINLICYPASP